MNDEAAFLAAIAAAPDDATLQLVFADWLEEHDDPRGKWSRNADIRPWMGVTFVNPIPPVLQALAKDKQVVAARRAADAIGAPIVPGLVELLKHASSRVREQACICLRKIGPRAKAAAPALMELLADPNDTVRGKAAKALRDVGADASADTSKLKAALTDDNWSVRSAASKVLGKMGAKASVLEELVVRFKSPDEQDRVEVVGGLKQLGTADVIPHLAAAAGDKAVAVRVAAVAALGVLKHPTAAPALCSAMADTHSAVREAAARQFAGYWRASAFTPDVVAALGRLLADRTAPVRRIACEALGNAGKHGGPAVRSLVARLEDDEPAVRAAAAQALGKVGTSDPAAVAPLLELLTDEPEVAGRAADALGNWKELPASAVPGLMAFVRRARAAAGWHLSAGAAFQALGKVASPPNAVLDALRASLRARDNEFGSAIEALTALGPAAAPAIPELLALLQEEHVPYGVVNALANVGGPAFDALTAILDGPDEDARSRVLMRMWDVREAGAPLLPALLRTYHRTTNDWLRSNILGAVGRLGPAAAAAVPELLDILDKWDRDDSPGDVFNAIRFLGAGLVPHLPRIAELSRKPHLARVRSSFAFLLAGTAEHTPDALDPLRAVLRDSYARADGAERWSRRDARAGAIQGLMRVALFHRISDPAAVIADLRPLVTDPEAPIRESLPPLLGRLGAPAAPLLCELLTDTEVGIRAKAADKLADAGDTSEETLTALAHAIEDRAPRVRRAAVDALNKLQTGSPEVLAALEAATGDDDKKVAERAAIALKKLTPKSPKTAAPKAKGKKKPT